MRAAKTWRRLRNALDDRSHMADEELLCHVAQIVASHERGIYTLLEANSQIMECITPQNVAEIFSQLPDEFVQRLKSDVEAAPTTDRDWDAVEYIHFGSMCELPGYEPPVISDDEQRAQEREWKRRHRVHIEAIRSYLGAQQ